MVRSSGAAYSHVKPVSVYWFYLVEANITVYHTYVAGCVVTHNGMNPGAAIVTRPSQQWQGFDQSPKELLNIPIQLKCILHLQKDCSKSPTGGVGILNGVAHSTCITHLGFHL